MHFWGFGGCSPKHECLFCLADSIFISDVLQFWCWYFQHEKVWGQCNLVEVAILFLKKGLKLCSVNKTLWLFLQPKLWHWKNERKICPWIGNAGEVACKFGGNMNRYTFKNIEFMWKTGQRFEAVGHSLSGVGLPKVPGESSQCCQLSQQGWSYCHVQMYNHISEHAWKQILLSFLRCVWTLLRCTWRSGFS